MVGGCDLAGFGVSSTLGLVLVASSFLSSIDPTDPFESAQFRARTDEVRGEHLQFKRGELILNSENEVGRNCAQSMCNE